jgi:hypothetical protein
VLAKIFYVGAFRSLIYQRATTSFTLITASGIAYILTRYPFWLSLHLLTFINLSESVRFVINAATKNWVSIVNAIVLIMFVMFSFVLIISQHYKWNLIEMGILIAIDNSRVPENDFCKTVLSCFMHIIDQKGLEWGTIAMLDYPMFEGHFFFYISRFVIDLVSYCGTGVIFYNAVYGIIIDTFTEKGLPATT